MTHSSGRRTCKPDVTGNRMGTVYFTLFPVDLPFNGSPKHLSSRKTFCKKSNVQSENILKLYADLLEGFRNCAKELVHQGFIVSFKNTLMFCLFMVSGEIFSTQISTEHLSCWATKMSPLYWGFILYKVHILHANPHSYIYVFFCL